MIEKQDIIYLTGMSINKKTLNLIYKHISKDNDFEKTITYLTQEKVDTKYSNTMWGLSIGSIPNTISTVADISQILDFILDILKNADLSHEHTYVLLVLSALNIYNIKRGAQITDKNKEPIKEYIKKMIKTLDKKSLFECINKINPIDCLNIYLANQSDIRSAIPLNKKQEVYIHYGYVDKPFYENRFIDSITIKFLKETEKCIKDATHIYYLITGSNILSRALLKLGSKEKDPLPIWEDILGIIDKKNLPELQNIIENQNIFGINLLSSILYGIRQNVLRGAKINVFISEKNDTKRLFIEEAISLSSHPSAFNIIDDEKDADIIFSGHFIDNENDIDEIKSYQYKADEFKVPIKMFFSLPIYIDDLGKEKVVRDIVVPTRLVDSYKEDMQIITVGGTEHNRALARLINLHRYECYKLEKKRRLGFIENMFDIAEKNTNGNIFLFGLNQPVSIYSNTLDTRKDNSNSLDSISASAKVIYFSLDDNNVMKSKNVRWHVISIYGFSALSSAYAALLSTIRIREGANSLLITNIIQENSSNTTENIINEGFYIENLPFICNLDRELRITCERFDYNCLLMKEKNEKASNLINLMLNQSLNKEN